MEQTRFRESTSSRGIALLWLGLFLAPAAWAIDLQVSYAIVWWVCLHGRSWILDVVSVSTLLIALGGFFAAWASWRDVRERPVEDRSFARARYMALSGVVLSGFFVLLIIATAIPNFFLGACS
jgi:hypothetical protein